MANILYANNAAGTLLAGITNVATSLTLNAGQGSAFPSPVNPQVFYVTLTDAATQTLIEIVKVTATSGDVFSIVRAQDGTSALSWNAGDIVSMRTIRLELQGFENAAEGNFAAQVVPITPSTTLGIVGTKIADNANAGSVGEFIFSQNTFGVTTGVPINVAANALSPGDWDVWGDVTFSPSVGTTMSLQSGGISATSGVFDPSRICTLGFTSSPGIGSTFTVPTTRINLSTATTIWLVVQATFSGGTCTSSGRLSSRRVR